MQYGQGPVAPGIYQQFQTPTSQELTIAETRVAGFAGVCQRGPLNEPVRIANYDEFVEVFGQAAAGYLAASVYLFFRNGGYACWVVRVAHTRGEPGEEVATAASLTLQDGWKKPAFEVQALDEGTWGNGVWVQCKHHTGAQVLLTRDLELGAGEAVVASTRGFTEGALARIVSRDGEDFVIITSVAGKALRWDSSTPVNRRHRASAPTHIEVIEFELHVVMRERREVFRGLQMSPRSPAYAPRVIASRSRLIRLRDLGSLSPVSYRRPQETKLERLGGGADGLGALTPEDVVGYDNGPGERAGLYALGVVEEVSTLVCPDAMRFWEQDRGPLGELKAQRVQAEMIQICESKRDRFAILDIPQSTDIEWVRHWRRRVDTSYAAYYWPWLRAELPGAVVTLPPSGVMAGVYSMRDGTDGVHHVAANIELRDVEDVALRVTENHLGLLNQDAVNSFRLQRGVRPWGARSASSDPQWRFVSVRRLFIMLRRSLEVGFSWVSFEPNDARTWSTITQRATNFLAGLQNKGMLVAGKNEPAFFVKCDQETNTPESIDNGFLICEIGVAPVSPAEFITISLVQTMSTSTSKDAP